jgi:hypothetical protein
VEVNNLTDPCPSWCARPADHDLTDPDCWDSVRAATGRIAISQDSLVDARGCASDANVIRL